MNTDDEGFWYPVVNNKSCIECGLCVKVCPLINKAEYSNAPIAYACINNALDIRLESSSGGIFTLIAEQIMASGGIVFGARFMITLIRVHDYVETKKGNT